MLGELEDAKVECGEWLQGEGGWNLHLPRRLSRASVSISINLILASFSQPQAPSYSDNSLSILAAHRRSYL